MRLTALTCALLATAACSAAPTGTSQPAAPATEAAPATAAPPAAPATAAPAAGPTPLKAATVLAALRAGKPGAAAPLLTGPIEITLENTSSEDPDVKKTLATAADVAAWLTEMHPCFRADAAEREECGAMNGLDDPGTATCAGDCCAFYGEEGPMVSHNSMYLKTICFADGGSRVASIYVMDGN